MVFCVFLKYGLSGFWIIFGISKNANSMFIAIFVKNLVQLFGLYEYYVDRLFWGGLFFYLKKCDKGWFLNVGGCGFWLLFVWAAFAVFFFLGWKLKKFIGIWRLWFWCCKNDLLNWNVKKLLVICVNDFDIS